MTTTTYFLQQDYSVKNTKTYLFSIIFICGNLILPQLCHLIPNGGFIFLPIYFFTLIASYKFGLKVGLLTAVFSPLANCLLFGMPILSMLPVIIIKSMLLATTASIIAKKSKSISLVLIALTILVYQVLGGAAEWILTSDFSVAVQDFRIGFPGMLIQLFCGWGLLKLLAKNEF
jgi:hypothetical protein